MFLLYYWLFLKYTLIQHLGAVAILKNKILCTINNQFFVSIKSCLRNIFVFRKTCLQLSPLNNLHGLDFSQIMAQICVKVLVVYAENDSPAFHFQSKQFAKVSYFILLFVSTDTITDYY